MKVEILGSSGCSTCESLKHDVERIVEEMGKEDEIDVVKVEDPARFASYGVMSTPALVADGEVEFKGTVPSSQEIREVLS
ncbi:thioredoxin family protein [Candidatus Bipolaricaulota bacterium]|nr:thioredoxin family protein [Candidatus Bipolaricaulota bacterium]MCF7890172.1 thioredoxin family protein [Candidatus Bipolaricaulota bacterium]